MQEKNKVAYNQIAQLFSDTRSYLWEDLRLPVFTNGLRSGDRVLDLGCGNGRLYQLFHDTGIAYIGLDQSGALLAIARARFPHALFVDGEMTMLPFPDASFERIYCIASFHHLVTRETQIAALAEMQRVLVANGRIVMLNWNLAGDWAETQLRKEKWRRGEHPGEVIVPWVSPGGTHVGDRHYYSFTLDELTSLVEAAGLTLVEQYYVKKGVRSDQNAGENMLSIIQKPEMLVRRS